MKTTWMRAGAVTAVCAVAGAAAGIAGSAAAPSKTTTAKSATTKKAAPRTEGRRGPGPGMGRGPVVHAEAVVLNKAGTAYITQTMDEGLVKSVSGNDLVIAEGTKAVPYKDVTVTVPADATIMRNGKTAKLSDLKAGDHVHVVSSSDGTLVFAGDDTFRPGGPHGPGDRDGDGGRGHHGPPPAGMP